MSMQVALSGHAEISKFSLKIHIRFITNRCVATRIDSREQAEWPPHPGRLYMAMVAAHFETDGPDDEKSEERQTLEWLAALPAPRIHWRQAFERSNVTYYVPVNDTPQPNKAMLQSAPGMSRSRQSRAFPTVVTCRIDGSDEADPDVTFEWADVNETDKHLSMLERLCRQVIRVGHSSSFVMAWSEISELATGTDCWEPAGSDAELTCRIAVPGEIDRLEEACRAGRINLFADLKMEIESSTGSAQKAAKQRFESAFGQPFKSILRPPEPTPAFLGVWQGYRRAFPTLSNDQRVLANSYFERELLILAKHEGPALNVERTLGLTQALRLTLIGIHGNSPIPAWLCGHDVNGSPTSTPHAAYLALPFSSHKHADGHLMGLAIALPKGIPAEERGRWLGPLLVNQETGDVERIKLWGKDLPDWTLELEDRVSPPLALQNETWTKPSTTWASVTPVVLDQFPKTSRGDDRSAWHSEVVAIIKVSCMRAGLPEPIGVDIDTTAWHVGIPRAFAKSRRLFGHSDGDATAPLGDGFPSLPSKKSRPPRPQVHVWMRFDRQISGPVLIGAGRFQGYGLCKPVNSKGELA